MSGLSAWWRSLGRVQRAVVAVLGAIVGLNLLLASFGSVFGGSRPGGPVSSSLSTGGDGLEGWADLLRRAGHPVERLEDAPAKVALPPQATVVVADPGKLSAADRKALAAFVAAGGRLVVAGESSAALLREVTGTSVAWDATSPATVLRTWVPVDGLQGGERLQGDRGGRWREVGPLVPVAGADGQPWMVVAEVGRGQVVAVADAGPLHNAHLASSDSAAVALAIVGEAGRPVVILESVHGKGATGLAALPPAWKWASLGLIVALGLGLWAAGARFGPPEPDHRTLRPPRLDHVEAVASDLEAVSAPPLDLEAALAEGATAAEAAQRRFGLDQAATVPHQPTQPGGTP
ncbi:MAG: DUF4350 domain-containing protein [Acidimicrobiales bacterium]